MPPSGHTPMKSRINPVEQGRIALLENRPSLCSRGREALAFPDLIKPSGITVITATEIDAPGA